MFVLTATKLDIVNKLLSEEGNLDAQTSISAVSPVEEGEGTTAHSEFFTESARLCAKGVFRVEHCGLCEM